jgi:hypothetical protein
MEMWQQSNSPKRQWACLFVSENTLLRMYCMELKGEEQAHDNLQGYRVL